MKPQPAHEEKGATGLALSWLENPIYTEKKGGEAPLPSVVSRQKLVPREEKAKPCKGELKKKKKRASSWGTSK